MKNLPTPTELVRSYVEPFVVTGRQIADSFHEVRDTEEYVLAEDARQLARKLARCQRALARARNR